MAATVRPAAAFDVARASHALRCDGMDLGDGEPEYLGDGRWRVNAVSRMVREPRVMVVVDGARAWTVERKTAAKEEAEQEVIFGSARKRGRKAG